MQDTEFYEMMYAGWAKTTGASDKFWMYEEDVNLPDNAIYAMNEDQEKVFIAGGVSEADAAFVTAIHGALPDMTRRLLDLTDEAERLDIEADNLKGELAEAYQREIDQTKYIEHLESLLEGEPNG